MSLLSFPLVQRSVRIVQPPQAGLARRHDTLHLLQRHLPLLRCVVWAVMPGPGIAPHVALWLPLPSPDASGQTLCLVQGLCFPFRPSWPTGRA